MNTEDRFASIGRQAFRYLVAEAGDQNAVVRLTETSLATVSRWVHTSPESPFGRRAARSWRPTWFGYPSPLPAFDRICERVVGLDYFGALGKAGEGLESFLARLRVDGLSLGRVGLDEASIVTAAKTIHVPKTTIARLKTTLPWPSQWTALDRLSLSIVEMGWPEFVVGFHAEKVSEKLPPAALRELAMPLAKRWRGDFA